MRNATCQITPLAYTKRRYKTLVGLVGNHLDGHCPCDDPLHGWERVRIYRCSMHLPTFPRAKCNVLHHDCPISFSTKERIILVQDYSVEFPEYSRLKEEHMAWKSPIFLFLRRQLRNYAKRGGGGGGKGRRKIFFSSRDCSANKSSFLPRKEQRRERKSVTEPQRYTAVAVPRFEYRTSYTVVPSDANEKALLRQRIAGDTPHGSPSLLSQKILSG